MFRTSDMVLIVVMVSAAAFTYKTKHDAEIQMAEVRRLQNQISFERDTIDVLQADWSLLNQPGRLQRLAGTYGEELELQPVEAYQFATISEIPMRPLQIEDLIANAVDGVETGSVAP